MCLWESVFPVILNHGLPRKHHLVIYLLTKVNETSDVLQNQIKVIIFFFLVCIKYFLLVKINYIVL